MRSWRLLSLAVNKSRDGGVVPYISTGPRLASTGTQDPVKPDNTHWESLLQHPARKPTPEGKVRIRFFDKNTDGTYMFVDAYTYPDISLKDVAEGAGIPIVAACGGTCKCSTCHMYILNGTRYGGEDGKTALAETNRIPIPPPQDDELDMLEQAVAKDANEWGGEGASRLSCQVFVTEEMEGLSVSVATGQVDRRYTR